MGSVTPSPAERIINLNVGGQLFATSRETLTWIHDSFFTSLLSGRIPTVRDGNGAIFIDRDPALFRIVLKFLRTKQVDLSSASLMDLKREAQYYLLEPLVKRLTLCEKVDECACGDVLLTTHIPAPTFLLAGSCGRSLSSRGSSSHSHNSSTPSCSSRSLFDEFLGNNRNVSEPASSLVSRAPSQPAFQSISSELSYSVPRKKAKLQKGGLSAMTPQSAPTSDQQLDSLRVRLIRADHNTIAVGYANFVRCYRMKENVGWQSVYTSPKMDATVRHIALNTKFGVHSIFKMLAVALANDVMHVYNNIYGSARQGTKIGTFSLSVPVDKFFFMGRQIVALSKIGKVGIFCSLTRTWQVHDVAPIRSYDTTGSFLLLGCANGSIYCIDTMELPLTVNELYRDPNADVITAISVYRKSGSETNVSGNWTEIAYGTSSGSVRVIVQHPEKVDDGLQLFQMYTVHTSPITRVALTTSHLISVCSEYNHVRSWVVTRLRGRISKQPGSTSLASFKVLTLDSTDDTLDADSTDPGPFGNQDSEQVFVQRIVPDANQIFVRLASNGDRLCTIRSVDGSAITAFLVHEYDRSDLTDRYLFTGTSNGTIQVWDLKTALDQYHARCSALSAPLNAQSGTEKGAAAGAAPPAANANANTAMFSNRPLGVVFQGPTAEEVLQVIGEREIC